jgi:hypothetical protein
VLRLLAAFPASSDTDVAGLGAASLSASQIAISRICTNRGSKTRQSTTRSDPQTALACALWCAAESWRHAVGPSLR